MRCILSLLFFLTTSLLSAQAQLEVINIVGQPEGDEVAVTFTLGKGNFCQGAVLFRTTDSTNLSSLEQVGEITGVCGSQDFEATYTLNDPTPYLNQESFYRLLLGDFPSQFISVQVNRYGANGVSVYPNPANQRVHFFIDNQRAKPWSVEVYQAQGQLVFETVQQGANSVIWNIPPQLSGIFFYHIYREDQLVTTQTLIIQ